ncbi:MAG: hypothetical protein K2Y56_13760 [Methylobacterium sp.]|uniref:hypothetical protein n=1 Tax=Methylobacterium sp. TaxID=409 RepID=UPI0025DCCF36|nr:hypothetical protein [Methylobacterium sp.]MBX9932586.1 hypothetical protein [Methylobacterium sp.]
MPATPEDVHARLTGAGRAAHEAAAGFARDSRAALARLKTRPIHERFAALEEGATQLLPEHRRELLLSIRNRADEAGSDTRPTPRHASRIAVWRGRLPFHARRLTRDALLALCLMSALVLAYRHTPISWVEVRGDRDVTAAWVMPDGRPAGDRLVAGRAYALMRDTAGVAELRDWRAGEGYAATRVPSDWLRTRAGPAAR